MLGLPKRIWKATPVPVKRAAKTGYSYLSGVTETMLGRRDSLTPPRHLVVKSRIGRGGYKSIGKGFLDHFQELCALDPGEKVLEMGCGTGRIAAPLAGYLRRDLGGSYEGTDIMPGAIAWCQKNISARYPHFRFYLLDIYNAEYNPSGKQKASEYEFPYPDDSFDFVFMTSVLTHLLPADMENYLSETARVLKPGGRCLITYMLLNHESLSLIEAGKSRLEMRFKEDGYYTTDRRTPENAVGYEESRLRELHDAFGLEIVEPIHYGSWCGRDGLDSQDIVVARKSA